MKQIYGHKKELSYIQKLTASENRPHTYLFSGKNGIGKRLVADYFGKALFCLETGKAPCNTCEKCKNYDLGRIQDVVRLVPDEKGRIRVGDNDEENTVRHFVQRLSEKPISGKCFALVDGIEKITAAGQNILLKTVEEPGSGVYIVLLASSLGQVLSTIESRSINVEFSSLSKKETLQALNWNVENHSLEDFAVTVSGGSPGIADSLIKDKTLEQVSAVVKSIKEFLTHRVPFDIDGKLEGFTSDYSLIDIVINCFYENFRLVVNKELQYNRYFEQLYLEDADVLQRLIKKLLLLKRDIRYNVNYRNAIKAVLYEVLDN